MEYLSTSKKRRVRQTEVIEDMMGVREEKRRKSQKELRVRSLIKIFYSKVPTDFGGWPISLTFFFFLFVFFGFLVFSFF